MFTMISGLADGSSEPEDPDALANRLLGQFQSSTSRHAPTTSSSVIPKPQWDPKPETSQATQYLPLEIDVPTVDNPDDYEYLPGHFAVGRILDIDSTNPQGPQYTVRLRSGEKETVRYNRHLFLFL